jgi:tRNA nucleotidyltransferase (CCA-adding enzyme)
VLLACECDARGRLGFEDSAYPQRPRLMSALHAAQAVETHAIATAAQQRGVSGPKIGELIQQARIEAVERLLNPASAQPPSEPAKRRSSRKA